MGKSAPIRWAARGNAPRESKVANAVMNVYTWYSRGCSCSSSSSHGGGGDSVVVSGGGSGSSAGARNSSGGDQ